MKLNHFPKRFATVEDWEAFMDGHETDIPPFVKIGKKIKINPRWEDARYEHVEKVSKKKK